MNLADVALQLFHLYIVLLGTLVLPQIEAVARQLVVLGREGDAYFGQTIVDFTIHIFLLALPRGELVVIHDAGNRHALQIGMCNAGQVIIITLALDILERGEFHIRDEHARLRHARGFQIDVHVAIVGIEPSGLWVVGSTRIDHFWCIALNVGFDGTGIAVAHHEETAVFLSPGHRHIVLGRSVLVEQRDIHHQVGRVFQGLTVEEHVHPKRIVGCKQAGVQIRGVRGFQPFVLQERHLTACHHPDVAVVEMGHQIFGPFIHINPHALEAVHFQPSLHNGIHQIVVEGVELAGLQVADGDGVGLGRLVVYLNVLQVVLTRHHTTAVEHHRAGTTRTVAVAVEGDGLGRFLALSERPYLDFNLLFAANRRDIDVVAGGIGLRRILRRVEGAGNALHANMKEPLGLGLVHAQHDILVVACIEKLFIETHRVFRRCIFHHFNETLHLIAIVNHAVVDSFPLKLTDVAPRV